MKLDQIQGLISLIDKLEAFIKKDDFLKHDERAQAILVQTRSNLYDRRYVVSIIAAMKAGKSTTFNALLGRDLLPNETQACTAAITEIKHAAKRGEEVIKVYKDGRSVKIAADAERTLEQNFHLDVRASRATNEVPYIEKYFVESPVLALEQTQYRDLVQNFILVDTPGPNEAQVTDVDVSELQRVALEKLRDSDALIMLLDFQVLKTDTNATILRNIFENREDLARDQNKIYFLVNKIDTLQAKDGTVEQVIESVRSLIRMYAPIIQDPQVFAFSAKQAQLARSVMLGTATDEAKEAMKKDYGVKYAREVEMDGEFFTVVPKPEQFAAKLLEDSGILHVESNIIDRIFGTASVKLVDNAVDRLQQVIGNSRNAVQSQIELSTRNNAELLTIVQESKKRIEQLRQEGERLKDIPKQEIDALKQRINGILDTLVPQSKEILNTYMSREYVQGPDQNYLIEQVQSMQQTVVSALQVMLNRETDKIQRSVMDTQGEINDKLVKAFADLSEEANAIVGKKMNLQFQVFRMGDLEHTMTNQIYIDEENIESHREEQTQEQGSMMKDVLKGAGIGFGSGIILPGIGNIAGAIVGGVVGLFKNLFSNRASAREIHRIELAPIRDSLNQYVHDHIDKLIEELSANIRTSNERYVKFVDGQLNLFSANLKNQLDKIIRDYDNNKDNLEKHLLHMNEIKEALAAAEEELSHLTSLQPIA
ncbi:dynamin family protein [Paenibacillus sp. MY03]|uniref:dynamin family protein n=1 Tax=Paenibacillus sp. MY03 TaxID=302980 RepID=UPI0015C640E1|nr:dynamin family protein [Paenibacillus sp. MY03]